MTSEHAQPERSDSEQATVRALMPHEYEMVWAIMEDGPLTACELARMRNARGKRYGCWTPQMVANQLRSLVTRGWITRVGGYYTVTERAIGSVSW